MDNEALQIPPSQVPTPPLSAGKNSLIVISVIAVCSGIISAIVSPYISGIIAPFLYPDFNTAGMVAIVYVLMTTLGVAVVIACLVGGISYVITHRWKYFFVGLLLCGLGTGIAYGLIYSVNKIRYEDNMASYTNELANKKQLAETTQIEVLEFQEQGETDEGGKLKKLKLYVKFSSNTEITINNPFGVEVLVPYYDDPASKKMCISTVLYPGDIEEAYQLKEGINELHTSITRFEPDFDTQTAYKTRNVEFAVYLAFRPHLELNEFGNSIYGQAYAPDITNVINKTGLEEYKECAPRDYFPGFKTRTYYVTYR